MVWIDLFGLNATIDIKCLMMMTKMMHKFKNEEGDGYSIENKIICIK
jgi:hypothetical protein